MTPIYKLDEAVAQADARESEFRGFYRIVLALEAIAALALLLFPGRVMQNEALAEAGLNPAITGALLLWAILFQIPGLLNPVKSRMPVVIGVIGRYLLALVLLLQGLLAAGVLVLIVAVALNFVFHALVRAVVMSRP